MSTVQQFTAIVVLLFTAGSVALMVFADYIERLKERDLWQARAKALENLVLQGQAKLGTPDQAKRGKFERLFSQARD